MMDSVDACGGAVEQESSVGNMMKAQTVQLRTRAVAGTLALAGLGMSLAE